ncbi:hypothetical protein [Streptomyces nitrosporeus]|uniref:hypothetical protein n=1 Tax=Streptomyces nitrosporeus TaxID=28894 RepID=UPI0039A3F763
MTVDRYAVEVRTFARYLCGLAALLDARQGWYGVFVTRDPEGMRACFEGVEVPPWDVVESLLQDLAGLRGDGFAARETARAAALYTAAVTAYDRRPGGRAALGDRLELMLREQEAAAHRLRAADAREAAHGPDGPEAVAWARDDHARATARCAELRRRLTALGSPMPAPVPATGTAPAPATGTAPASAAGTAPSPGSAVASAGAGPGAGTASRRTRGRPRGARFAGLDLEDEASTSPAPSSLPVMPLTPSAAPALRGARFGAAPAREAGPAPRTTDPGPAAVRAAEQAVGLLLRLRAEGRGGEAHAVLCEMARRPAVHLPVCVSALHRAGLAADRATLLWEVSSLPPAALAAAAGALAEAGHDDDWRQVLRQGVARPAAEVADAVAALDEAGPGPQAQVLLGAFVRVRTPQDVARVAQGRPRHLVPRLLAAAREVSAARERDLAHALRAAGIAVP